MQQISEMELLKIELKLDIVEGKPLDEVYGKISGQPGFDINDMTKIEEYFGFFDDQDAAKKIAIIGFLQGKVTDATVQAVLNDHLALAQFAVNALTLAQLKEKIGAYIAGGVNDLNLSVLMMNTLAAQGFNENAAMIRQLYDQVRAREAAA